MFCLIVVYIIISIAIIAAYILCTVHIFKSAWVFYHWLNKINNKNYCNILLNIKICITFSTIDIRALINIGEDLGWISQETHYTYFKQERTMSLYTCIHYLHPAAQEVNKMTHGGGVLTGALN